MALAAPLPFLMLTEPVAVDRSVPIILHLDYATRTAAPDRDAAITPNPLTAAVTGHWASTVIVANTLRTTVTPSMLTVAVTSHRVTAQITPSVKTVVITDAPT